MTDALLHAEALHAGYITAAGPSAMTLSKGSCLPVDLLDDGQLVQVEGGDAGMANAIGQLHDVLSILVNILADIRHAQQLLNRWPHLQHKHTHEADTPDPNARWPNSKVCMRQL